MGARDPGRRTVNGNHFRKLYEWFRGRPDRVERTFPLLAGRQHGRGFLETPYDLEQDRKTGEAIAYCKYCQYSHSFPVAGRARSGLTMARLAGRRMLKHMKEQHPEKLK